MPDTSAGIIVIALIIFSIWLAGKPELIKKVLHKLEEATRKI